MIILLNIFVIMFFTILNTYRIYSQISQEWINRYNIGTANSIVVDQIGNIYLGGTSNNDYISIKYNQSGSQQWVVRYNGPGNSSDLLSAISLDDSGNLYVTGRSVGNGTGVDFATIKYKSNGVQQWVARYTSPENHRDASYAISINKKGDIYVAGESQNDIGGIEYLTIKYDSSGSQLWTAKYNRGKNSSNQAFAITNDNSGNVFVSGRSDGDFATVKYNSSGVQQWVTVYNGPMNENDAAKSIEVDYNGNVYVSGSSVGTMFYYDYATVKYNSNGEEQWVRRYDGTSHFEDHINKMSIDKYGNVYVTGNSTESGQGYNMTTIKYGTNGDTLWKTSYHNGLNDIAFALALDNLDNVYVTGESDGNGTGYDYATVKYDSNGTQKFVMRYTSIGDSEDVSQAIAVDKSGNVFVTGYSGRDILTIKYSQLTVMGTIFSYFPMKYSLSQNYPNPFNHSTKINYELPASRSTSTFGGQSGRIKNYELVSLNIYDLLGKKVATLLNQKQNSGRYELEFDGSNLASGIYFYSLMLNGKLIDTKRMLLLK